MKVEAKRLLQTGEAAKKFNVSNRTIREWVALLPFEVMTNQQGWLKFDERAMKGLELIDELRKEKLSFDEIRQCLIDAFDAKGATTEVPELAAVTSTTLEGSASLGQLVTVFERYSELASKYSDALDEINSLKEKIRRLEYEAERNSKQPFMRVSGPMMRYTR